MLTGMESEPESPGGKEPMKGAQFMTLGFEMAIPVVLLMYLGRWADGRLGTEPWLFLVGAFLGIAVGFYSMFKRVGLICPTKR